MGVEMGGLGGPPAVVCGDQPVQGDVAGWRGRFLPDPTTVAVVARSGNRVLGWAWGYRQIRPDGDTMLLLYELDVVDEERRKGIGTSLVEAFLELGQREGHRKMWVLTEVDNEAAIALYEATGGERAQGGRVSYQWALLQRR